MARRILTKAQEADIANALTPYFLGAKQESLVAVADIMTDVAYDWAFDNTTTQVNALANDLASSDPGKGADMVGFLQSGTGAVPRTLGDKALETVTDGDYGIVGNGVTDDKAAFDNALAGAIASGRVLVLDGSKTYGIGGFLSLPANLRMQTNGATFRDLTGTASNTPFITVGESNVIDELNVEIPAGIRRDRAVLVTAANPQIDRIYVRSVDQQANTAENDDAGIRVSVSSGARIRHIEVANYDRAAIFRSSVNLRVFSLKVDNYVRGLQIENCQQCVVDVAAIKGASANTSYTAGNVGVLLSSSTTDAQRNITLQDFVVEDSGEHGIRVAGPAQQSNIHIVRPRIKNVGGSGIKILGTDSGTPSETNKRIFITDPIIEDCASGGLTSNMCGILVMFSEGVQITNPVVRKQGKLYSGYAGIRVVASSDVTITNPGVSEAKFDGIYLDGSLGKLARVDANGGWSRFNGRDGYRLSGFTSEIEDCNVDGLKCWFNTGLGATLAGTGSVVTGRPSFRFLVAGNTGGGLASDRNAWTLHVEGAPAATPMSGVFARNGSTWNDHTTLNLMKAATWTAL